MWTSEFQSILVRCTKFSSVFGGVSHHSFIVLSLELSEKLRRMKLAHPESRSHAYIVNIELAERAKLHVGWRILSTYTFSIAIRINFQPIKADR